MTKKLGTPEEENSRHWLLAIYYQFAIRVYYMYDQWFGLKYLFCGLSGYSSNFKPKNAPKIDQFTQTCFFLIWTIAAFTREVPIIYGILCKIGFFTVLNKFHEYISKRLEKKILASGWTEKEREIPIPEYNWKEGSPEEFHELFVKHLHPVVLRGFMKDTDLLKKLNWDTVLSKYGEEDVFLTKKELDGFPGKLKEVNNNNVYLHNSEKLFIKYPEIRNLFQYSRLEPYLKMKVGYEQLFVGRQGTGSPFHNASNYNFFYMVDGSKTWWFIDPADSFLAYPLVILGRAAGFLLCLWPDQYLKEYFPLFKYCPLFTTTINPGDVLFNPPWWWHSIKNVTETTVGVASRWHTDGILGHQLVMSEEDYNINRFMSMAFMAGLGSIPFLHGILLTPSPRFDEHLSLREVKNRYVHKQIELANQGGVIAAGVRTPY